MFRLSVEYTVGDNLDLLREMDTQIEKLLSRENDGTGFEFASRTRDIGFEYETEAEAVEARKIVRKAKLKVKTYIFNLDE